MNETLEQARERYQASLVEGGGPPGDPSHNFGQPNTGKKWQPPVNMAKYQKGDRVSIKGKAGVVLSSPNRYTVYVQHDDGEHVGVSEKDIDPPVVKEGAPQADTAVVHHSKKRPGEDADQRRTIVPIATKRTSPPRKDIPSQRVKPDVVEEGEGARRVIDKLTGRKGTVKATGKTHQSFSGTGGLSGGTHTSPGSSVDWDDGEQSNTISDDRLKNEIEEGMEEEVPMTEAQKKFVEGLKAGADCYTTQVDGGRLVRSQKSEGDTTSAPGADEGKPAPKKMADLLKEAKAKFAENIINNSAPSPGSFSQAKATFAEGLKNHCNKGK